MAQANNNEGLWLTSFQQGLAANRPTTFPGEGNLAFFFATDTGALSVAAKTTDGTVTWVTLLANGKNAGLPTSDSGIPSGALYSDSGTVKVKS